MRCSGAASIMSRTNPKLNNRWAAAEKGIKKRYKETVTHQVNSSDKQLPGHSNQAESTGTYSELQTPNSKLLTSECQLHFHFHHGGDHLYDDHDVQVQCSITIGWLDSTADALWTKP